MLISIVIPCYNEGKACLDAILKLDEYFRENHILDYEVIFVDDGSKDSTRQYIEACETQFKGQVKSVVYDTNRGKGYAVRQGLEKAQGTYVFYLDTDMATDLSFIKDAINNLQQGYDVVMGSRRLPGSITNETDNVVRNIVSKGCVLCSKMIVPELNFTDTQCGCKAMKLEVVKEILPKLTIDGFSFDIEILTNCIKSNFKVKEIPIIWKNRDKGSKVDVVSDSVKFFKDLFYIRATTRK